MSATSEKWLGLLDMVLKNSERRDAEKAAARDARKNGQPKLATRSFGVALPTDSSCCLAKRRFDK